MPKVEIYSKYFCPFCKRAKHLLKQLNVPFEEIEISFNPQLQAEMKRRSQRTTVPQIFIDGEHIGGSDDLVRAHQNGNLDRLLSQTAA